MKKTVGTIFEKRITGNPLYDQDLERAPWEIEIGHYARIENPDLIEKSLNVIKNDYLLLVLASLDGERYGNTILVDFDQEVLTIDKPNNFDEKSVNFFRIYFKDILDEWSFFQVRTLSECALTLCSTYPEALYRLQRRQFHRIDLPEGTRTVFWEEDQLRDGGVVKDLSAVGMLICTGLTEEKFQENTVISEIAIALPCHPSSRRKNDEKERVVLPVIKKGRIVRSFKDSETNLIYHGVAFDKDDESEDELTRFVEVVRGDNPGNK